MDSKRKRTSDDHFDESSTKRSKLTSTEEIVDSSSNIEEIQEEYQYPIINENSPFTQNLTIPQINKLIDVRSFKIIVMKTRQHDNALIEKYGDCEDDYEVSDLIYKSPSKIVKESIEEAMKDPSIKEINDTAQLLASAKVVKYDELERKKREANLHSMRQLNQLIEQGIRPKLKEVNYMPKTPQDIDRPMVPIDINEVIISVSIYHPKKRTKMQSFSVLGSQKLKTLRDCFYCLSDVVLPKNTSSFFFIENHFYSDFSEKDNVDYATPIIEWMKGQSKFWSKYTYQHSKMEDTTFEDLKIKIGKKYLYFHQGDCEHIITFDELRMVTENDSQNLKDYPIQTFQSKIRRRKCRICKVTNATFITYNDFKAPENPTYFCEPCFKILHPNNENQHPSYVVYNYIHD